MAFRWLSDGFPMAFRWLSHCFRHSFVIVLSFVYKSILLFFCLDPSLQIVIKWFSPNFYYLLISFQSRLCDRSDISLVIDSAVAYYKKDGPEVMLFSGDRFYESYFVNITANRMDFTVKSIKQLDNKLEPPIDTAYNEIVYNGIGPIDTIGLYLINVS